MSISTVEIIQTRIRVATLDSPIAVFKLPIRQSGFLEAVFGSTVRTHQLIADDDYLFVGYFHNGMAKSDVCKILAGAARG